MPYRIEWQQQNRVGKLTVWADFPLEEMRAFTQLFATQFLDTGSPPVHLIADLSQMQKHPTQIAALRDATAKFLEHPNMGWLLIAGSTPLVGYLATVVTHLTHTRYRSALNVEDALTSLKRADISLKSS